MSSYSNHRRRGLTLGGFLKLVVVILVLLVIGWTTGGPTVSDGDRVGQVTKFSRKGLVFKTWEGEMLAGERGAVAKDAWAFSVRKNNPEVMKKVEDALKSGRSVRLSYKEKMFAAFWRGDTKYFITEVNPVAQ
jgi:hypothetical protein